MRVLIAPDRFGDSLTAKQTAMAMAEGWSRGAPHDQITIVPLADGGPGFLDVLADGLTGRIIPLVVDDPLGRAVPAAVLLVDGATGRTAYLESTSAVGRHLLSPQERDPTVATSFGVGQLLEAARGEGADKIVVGVSSAATHDAGAGMFAALGVEPVGALTGGGLALSTIAPAQLTGFDQARRRYADIEIVLGTEWDGPLLGFEGASASHAIEAGAGAAESQALESALGHFAHAAQRMLGMRRELLSGANIRLDREPGAGAGGGLGWALLLLGGHRVSAVAQVLEAVNFDERLASHDLVVTGEAVLDWRSIRAGVVPQVASAAASHAMPVVSISRQLQLGRREAMNCGLSAAYSVADTHSQLDAALLDPIATLSARTERVARTWSPAAT